MFLFLPPSPSEPLKINQKPSTKGCKFVHEGAFSAGAAAAPMMQIGAGAEAFASSRRTSRDSNLTSSDSIRVQGVRFSQVARAEAFESPVPPGTPLQLLLCYTAAFISLFAMRCAHRRPPFHSFRFVALTPFRKFQNVTQCFKTSVLY